MEQYPINTTCNGTKASTFMAGYYKYGIATILTNKSFKGGATAIAMRIPEATKQGYVDIDEGECVDLAQINSKTRRGRKMEEKSNCLTTQMSFYQLVGKARPINAREDGKSPTLLASYGAKCGVGLPTSYGANKSFLRIAEEVEQVNDENYQVIGCAERGRYLYDGKTEQHLELRKDEKSNAITTVTKDAMVCSPKKVGTLGSDSQGNRIYSVRGKSVSIVSQGGGKGAKTGLYMIDLPDGDYLIRKLYPIEAERLQTLPDNYTEGVSDTQRYKCIGNGWTIDVIAHIFKGLKEV